MALSVKKVDVWVAEIQDQPGGLARVLGALGDAGASVECVIARRQSDGAGSGSGVVFVSPVKGKRATDAARAAGMNQASDLGTLKVEGPDQPGLGGRITQAIAEANISLKGVSAAVIGNKFVAYLGFDSEADATRAMAALKNVNGGARGKARGGSRARR
jgi:hypothetical protein